MILSHRKRILSFLILLLFIGSCATKQDATTKSITTPESPQKALTDEIKEEIKDETGATDEENFVGKWRIYSQAIFYDKGGNDWLDTPSTRLLEIKEDGRWIFGSSSGKWKVSMIEPQDWAKWTVSSYGPARKIVLSGWNNGVADGPAEESGERVDFIWVIYHAEPPIVTWPGLVQIKFGHTNEDI